MLVERITFHDGSRLFYSSESAFLDITDGRNYIKEEEWKSVELSLSDRHPSLCVVVVERTHRPDEHLIM